MHLELVDDVANAAHPVRRPDQSVNFLAQDRPAQPDASCGRVNGDGMRMSNNAAELRAHALDEDDIVNRAAIEGAADARDGTRRTMAQVAAGGSHGVHTEVSGMRELVLDERATPAATLGVEEVHEPDANTQARQRRSAIT